MTKVTAFILAILVSSTVMASVNNSELVYKALNVQEENSVQATNMLPATGTKKSVGGLNCQTGIVMAARPIKSYDCTLALDNRDDAAIYQALNVQEVNVTPEGLLGASTFQKQVGNLVCQRQQVVYPNAPSSFACSVQ